MAISLEGAIRTCKVNTGWASRIESDRIQNPQMMQCNIWNGMDTAGRPVCADSFYTKSAGCNSPLDRVVVENGLRPRYFEFITLDAAGLAGSNMNASDTMQRQRDLNNMKTVTGNFGNQQGSNVRTGCEQYSYNRAMAQNAQANRMGQGLTEGFRCNQMRKASGM